LTDKNEGGEEGGKKTRGRTYLTLVGAYDDDAGDSLSKVTIDRGAGRGLVAFEWLGEGKEGVGDAEREGEGDGLEGGEEGGREGGR